MGLFHLPVCQVGSPYLLCLCFTFMQFFFQSGSILSTSLLGQATTFLLCLCLLAPHKCIYENIYVFILLMFMFNFQKLKQVNTFFYELFSKYKKIYLFISCFVENTNLLGCLSLQKLSPTCLSSVRKVDATEWNFEKMLIRPWWGRIKKIPVTYSMKFQTTRSLCIKLMCTCEL